jgi:hypothetical protein
MVYPRDCIRKYGVPAPHNPWLTLWDVPSNLEIGVIPKRIYCNKDLILPLSNAFANLISRGHVKELKTWDGCFNIRKMRGLKSWSLHSWGIAIDLNAFENGLGKEPKLSSEFVKCFTDAGMDWGGFWKTRVDGMHFQLSNIL